MLKTSHASLSRRERHMMDILYRRGRATAAEVLARLPGSPSSSTVRTQLRVLEDKGHVRHVEEGLRYVYAPVVSRQSARKTALRHLLHTFFDGSPADLMTTLLGDDDAGLSAADIERIEKLLKDAKKEDA
jgi:predicted transcriptional regulator